MASLPQGLRSHPGCECKASLYREAMTNLPRTMDVRGLEPSLADYFVNPMPVNTWIPEVINTALFLAMADAFFPLDNAFLDWVSSWSEATMRAPMYRILMTVASPQVLAQGGTRRWKTFHVGSELETTITENGTDSILRFPENAFDALVVRGTLRAVQAAYRASGAKNATVELVQFTPVEARYRSVWYPERR